MQQDKLKEFYSVCILQIDVYPIIYFVKLAYAWVWPGNFIHYKKFGRVTTSWNDRINIRTVECSASIDKER